MDYDERPSDPLAGSGLALAPIHSSNENTPLSVCVLVRLEVEPANGPFVLLREIPGVRVYLGAICDAQGRIQDWVELWAQTDEIPELAFSGYQEQLTNSSLDRRWRSDFETALANLPEMVIVTGMETRNPSPILIHRPANPGTTRVAPTMPARWQLCQDDALLESCGLPAYSGSRFRYLHPPGGTETGVFIATKADAPANARVQTLDALKTGGEVLAVFNPVAGLVRVQRFTPLELESFLGILEGLPWAESEPRANLFPLKGVYADLRSWAGQQKALPFLLHATGTEADRLNELFYLKLSLLLGIFKEVRACVKARQLPLLNLAPASFRVWLPEVGDQFPALWGAKCLLVRPGQAFALSIAASEQRYFVRSGHVEASAFLPEGLGAHSHGLGSVRRRNVLAEANDLVLEGTLVAQDYLAPDSNDLLWFKLPVGEERLECFAHVHTGEAVGPREARFRTLPMKVSDSVAAVLKNTAVFAKAPYEIWPLLSSPCDLYSLGIIAARVLLANSKSNLPVVMDDVLGLARSVGKDAGSEGELPDKVRGILNKGDGLSKLVSPHALLETGSRAERAAALVNVDLWCEAVAWLLRLFPGAGAQSYCKSFGDVTPLALEKAFDAPVHDLENLTRRMRSILVPTTAANREITDIILQHLSEE